MDIDRRGLLSVTACLALTELVGPALAHPPPAGTDEEGNARSWHRITRSLLARASRTGSVHEPLDTAGVERIIHDMADARSRANRPVIKWLADPSAAFDHLGRYSLDALLRMESANLWRREVPSISFDERSLDLSFALRGVVSDIVGAEHHTRALMAPKLLAKSHAMAASASSKAVFEVRAVAAQIGWLETCVPVAAAQAVADVELLLSSGFSEHDMSIHHQLRVFEAYELGLLATWETPDTVICVPITARRGYP